MKDATEKQRRPSGPKQTIVEQGLRPHPGPTKRRLCYKTVPEEAGEERMTRRRIRGKNPMAEHACAYGGWKCSSNLQQQQQQPIPIPGQGTEKQKDAPIGFPDCFDSANLVQEMDHVEA